MSKSKQPFLPGTTLTLCEAISVLDLLNDGAFIETAECRLTRWGKFAAVVVDAKQHFPKGVKVS